MTTNKPGTVAQRPLFGCANCYEDFSYPADHLHVYNGECWCEICWEEATHEIADGLDWRELEPFKPAPQPAEQQSAPAVQGEPVGRVKTVGGYPDESEHTVEWLCKYRDLKDGDLLYTAPQPAEQQSAPAVQAEPVGRVKTVGGYPDESEHTVEWLCKYRDLKDGDLLYTAPQPAEQQSAPAVQGEPEIEPYDAGSLNDFGGGNVGWWHDYIRAELDRAYEFYLIQLADAPHQAPQPSTLLPIEEAPKDGTVILAWCVHEADPYCDDETGRLTAYGANAEGMSHVDDGWNLVHWQEGFFDGEYHVPGWWTLADGCGETAANPVLWVPLPTNPKPEDIPGEALAAHRRGGGTADVAGGINQCSD